MTELTADELASIYGVPTWAARLATDGDEAQRARAARRQQLADAYGVRLADIPDDADTDDERTE